MARNRGSQVVGMVALGGVTIALGAALGYFVIGGAHQDHSGTDTPGVQQASAPPATASTPKPITRPLVHVRPDSDYSAPGAPRIRIVEDPNPTLNTSGHRHLSPPTPDVTTTTDIPTPDVEASQQGVSDSGNNGPSTPDTPVPPAPSVGPAPSATPAPDPEASQTGTPPTNSATTPGVPPTPDPEASQTGTPNPSPVPNQRAQYRIQAGAFGSSQDAQDYVNTLHGKGLDASVSPQRQGGQTVYKVQVGAYHDRDAAEQAASDLRRQGVPVTVSPISP